MKETQRAAVTQIGRACLFCLFVSPLVCFPHFLSSLPVFVCVFRYVNVYKCTYTDKNSCFEIIIQISGEQKPVNGSYTLQ